MPHPAQRVTCRAPAVPLASTSHTMQPACVPICLCCLLPVRVRCHASPSCVPSCVCRQRRADQPCRLSTSASSCACPMCPPASPSASCVGFTRRLMLAHTTHAHAPCFTPPRRRAHARVRACKGERERATIAPLACLHTPPSPATPVTAPARDAAGRSGAASAVAAAAQVGREQRGGSMERVGLAVSRAHSGRLP